MTESSIKKMLGHHHWPMWARQLWHCLFIYKQDVQRTDLTKQASAMAYITLFSLVPSLAAIFTLLGLFLPVLGNHAGLLDDARQFLLKNLATGSGSQVIDYLEGFLAGLNLKKIGMSAFVGLLVTLVLLLRQIEEALNRIWLVSDSRPMLTRFIYFWLFLTLGMFGLSVLIGLSTSYSVTTLITKKTLAAADRADDIPIISMTFSWFLGCVVFFLAYKIVPNCEVRNRPALRGAVLAGTLFYALSKLYTIYVASFASYKSVYGTLAALPIFLMWIYVCWLIVLAGALFAWRTQAGFPSIDEDKTIEAATSYLDHLRNHAIKSRLPLLTLLTIHHKFLEGSGDGLSTGTLVAKLRLPHAWVHDATEVLREQKFVISARVAGSDSEKWFPTNPSDKVDLTKFIELLNEPLDKWVEAWEPEIPEQVKAVISSTEGVKAGVTVAKLLAHR